MDMTHEAFKELVMRDDRNQRIPPGQIPTEKFPIMTATFTPSIDRDQWHLHITGSTTEPLILDWEQFMAMPQMAMNKDFHCVTQWSSLNVSWEGVPASEVLARAKPLPEAAFVMVHCYDGYTTNLDLAILTEESALFAHHKDGLPLKPDHGAPVRLVLPRRYGWKSAKWVHRLEVMTEDRPGFWELRGYHMRGDPWLEQRFWD